MNAITTEGYRAKIFPLLCMGIFAFFCSNNIYADLSSGGIQAFLDKNRGELGDQFQLSISLPDSPDEEISIPPIKNVEITSAGTSSQTTIINGKISSEYKHNFILTPLSSGKFRIDPITIVLQGKRFKTNALEFEVLDQAAATAQAGNNREMFVERVFSKENPFVGEPIIMTVRFYYRVSLSGGQPKFDFPTSFRAFEASKERSYRKVLNSNQYQVSEFTITAIPLKEGSFELDPYRIDVDYIVRGSRRRVDPMFDFFKGFGRETKRKMVMSDKAVINVRPLPSDASYPNVPFSGLIGEFNIDVNLTSDTVKVGDTATLSIDVEGDGLVDQFKGLSMDFGSTVKVYKDKPVETMNIRFNGKIESKASFKYGLVPLQPGKISLPDLSIKTFDPRSEKYVLHGKALPALTVTGTKAPVVASSAGTPSGKQALDGRSEVKSTGSDIIDIRRQPDLSAGIGLNLMDKLLVVAIWLLAMILFLKNALRGMLFKSQNENRGPRKSQLVKEFKTLRRKWQEGEAITQIDSLVSFSKEVKRLFAFKFRKKAQVFTAEEIRKTCLRHRCDAKQTEDLVAALKEVENAEYGGSQVLAKDKLRNLFQKISENSEKLLGH